MVLNVILIIIVRNISFLVLILRNLTKRGNIVEGIWNGTESVFDRINEGTDKRFKG